MLPGRSIISSFEALSEESSLSMIWIAITFGSNGGIIHETHTICYAWALIPNHFHLLLRTGQVPIATFMMRLLTGHAGYFNKRHRRSGHLFQNRYKSILCQEEPYLLELVRYIHLNPLRASIIQDLDRLKDYPYGGHSALMGKIQRDWQDTEWVLRLFDERVQDARRRYHEFVEKGYQRVVEKI